MSVSQVTQFVVRPIPQLNASLINWSCAVQELFLKIYQPEEMTQVEFQQSIEKIYQGISFVLIKSKPDFLESQRKFVQSQTTLVYAEVIQKVKKPDEVIQALVKTALFDKLTEAQVEQDQKNYKMIFDFNLKYLAPRALKKLPSILPAAHQWLTQVTLANTSHAILLNICKPMSVLPEGIIDEVLDERARIGEECLLSGNFTAEHCAELIKVAKNQKVQFVWDKISPFFDKSRPKTLIDDVAPKITLFMLMETAQFSKEDRLVLRELVSQSTVQKVWNRIAALFKKTDPHNLDFRESYIAGLHVLLIKLRSAEQEAIQKQEAVVSRPLAS